MVQDLRRYTAGISEISKGGQRGSALGRAAANIHAGQTQHDMERDLSIGRVWWQHLHNPIVATAQGRVQQKKFVRPDKNFFLHNRTWVLACCATIEFSLRKTAPSASFHIV